MAITYCLGGIAATRTSSSVACVGIRAERKDGHGKSHLQSQKERKVSKNVHRNVWLQIMNRNCMRLF